jgi:hypothetical protein
MLGTWEYTDEGLEPLSPEDLACLAVLTERLLAEPCDTRP